MRAKTRCPVLRWKSVYPTDEKENEGGYILHAKLCESDKAIANKQLADLVGTMREEKRTFEAELSTQCRNRLHARDLMSQKQFGKLLSAGATYTEPTKNIVSALVGGRLLSSERPLSVPENPNGPCNLRTRETMCSHV